jgi:N-acetylneuraminic acid mutarotase
VVVAVGGEDDKVVMRSVEFWDPVNDIWKTLACLPFAVSKHGLVVSGQSKLYMAGGEYPDGSASRAMWRFDPALNAWHEMAGMNVCRSVFLFIQYYTTIFSALYNSSFIPYCDRIQPCIGRFARLKH